jgi:hypothetical protein
MNRKAAFALGLLISVTLTALAATGGYPSRPIFQSVGVNTIAPATAGSIAATTATFTSAANQGGVRLTSASPTHVWTESDATADNQSWRIRVNGEALGWYAVNDAFGAENAFITVQRTGTTIDSVDIAGTAVTANGVGVATETSGTFTATFDDACTTSPTLTFDYVKTGSQVTVIETAQTGMGCTGDSTSFATTGAPIPAALRPTASTTVRFRGSGSLVNNGANVDSCVTFSSSGNVVFHTYASSDCNVTGWTAAGTRNGAVIGATYTWHVLNP